MIMEVTIDGQAHRIEVDPSNWRLMNFLQDMVGQGHNPAQVLCDLATAYLIGADYPRLFPPKTSVEPHSTSG